jgi:hypothetical protein
MTQHEITRSIPLLNAAGELTEPGYAKRMLPVYRRKDIRAGKLRIKEWDYYLINNGRFALALTVADNGYMGMDSISLLDFEEGWEITKSPMSVLPAGRLHMPETTRFGDVRHGGKRHALAFENEQVIDDFIHEITIVADDDDTAGEILQVFLQYL